jgi:hypothetical protein
VASNKFNFGYDGEARFLHRQWALDLVVAARDEETAREVG